jgi:hypothetical protein
VCDVHGFRPNKCWGCELTSHTEVYTGKVDDQQGNYILVDRWKKSESLNNVKEPAEYKGFEKSRLE